MSEVPRQSEQGLFSIQDSAALLGVSADTIRRRVKAGQLEGVRVPRPQGHFWRVRLPSSPSTENPYLSAPKDPPALVNVLQEQIRFLTGELTARREENARLLELLGIAIQTINIK